MKRKASAPGLPKKRYYKKRKMTRVDKINSAAKIGKNYKYYDNSTPAGGGISISGTVPILFTQMGAVVRGTGMNQYIGSQVKMISWDFRFSCSIADSFNYIRVMMIQWLGDKVPVVADIIEDPTKVWSSILFSAKDDVVVLRDIMIEGSINITGTTAAAARNDCQRIYIKGKKLVNIQYNQASGITNGNPFLLIMSDSLVAPHPVINYYSRMIFDDTI